MNSDTKKLVLFTSDFPFGTGETFLETEISYLAKGFDHVHIISSSGSEVQTRSLPENCSVERIDLQLSTWKKLAALKFIFHPIFWQELKIIRSIYQKKMSKGILATMLISLFQAKRVVKIARKIIVHADPSEKVYFYSYWCDDAALGLAMVQQKFDHIKTFCRIHRWDVYFEESTVGYLPYRHFITKHIGKIFSISEDGIDYALGIWKTEFDHKFQLSRLGISNDKPVNQVERDFFLIVSCSNLIPVKRVHLIPEALKFITVQRIKWVHIGDGPERHRIENAIQNLPSNIEVELLGRIPNSAIYDYYDQHRPDLFINVSSSEGVPVSIMEAMSFGIPVIATDVGGNGEIVNEGNGVLLLDQLVVDELVNKLVSLMNNKVALTFKKECAFRMWQENFNSEKNYQDFVQKLMNL